MSEEPNSFLNTIKYYKNLLKFPQLQKPYSELDETQEQKELFFCNSKQRKDESLRILKEWAQNRMDIFEKNREIVEELANGCDFRIRLSVDFLQIIYKFFNEKYFQEQQYSQFLLTKPQPALKQNPLSSQVYQPVAQAISTFEENNLKRCEKIAVFAHIIQQKILKAETFNQLGDYDKQLDLLLASIITQKRLLQNYITSAGQKLSLIIHQFPSQQVTQRQRKPIFDEQPQQQQQQSKTEKILQNISTLGTLLVGANAQFQDPVELELNNQLKQQEQHLREIQLKEEQSLSNGTEQEKQPTIDNIQTVLADQQDIQQNNDIKQEEQQKIEVDNEDKQIQKEEIAQENIKPIQISEEQNHNLSSAELYKLQQQQKEKIQNNEQKSKKYASQNEPNEQQKQNEQKQQNKTSQIDLYRAIISFIASQQYANKLLNQLAQKVIQYWELVMSIETKRAQWAKESVEIYKNGIEEAHGQKIDIIDFEINIEEHYSHLRLLPKELITLEDKESLIQSLTIKEIGCSSAKLLLVKEFKVHVLDKNAEFPAILVITIDKYIGCWLKHDDTTEAVDNPVFHFPINGMQYQKSSDLILDFMPSRHLLFLNIANDKQKSRIKFQCQDDMEELCTIASSQ